MQITITGRNIDLTEGLKAAVEERLVKLERYLSADTQVNVTLDSQKGRNKMEVTIPMKGTILRTEQVSDDMYVTIELATEVLERQLIKYKNKMVTHYQSGANLKQEFIDSDTEDDEIKIVRTKRFGMKPMFAEDACVQMELLGHEFFVFRNADTDEVNVVYKRKDGAYGLIEPEC
ncbi:ribosome hibernation-promoting factor, HPF/YfiA family [Eubacterium oxidoreducens]|uniref:Ribosome hibernation promoting factor n=1 Tax=Eubacterium oxidoreducens TaxID=1732 RepID=A0A1G6CL58_EUBOX|nr:ribosome-associated translation inhibitor RaiA [Eubacterium oxidoreducens]SDB33623.1 putative sigma-54 modulation protein [Eubacterium oxidoreducens]